MSEQPTAPAAPTSEPGPLTRLAEKFTGHAEHLEADAAHVASDVTGFLTDHASTVYDFAGDFLAAVKLIDPADAAALTAFGALIPKVFAMAGKVSSLAEAATKPS